MTSRRVIDKFRSPFSSKLKLGVNSECYSAVDSQITFTNYESRGPEEHIIVHGETLQGNLDRARLWLRDLSNSDWDKELSVEVRIWEVTPSEENRMLPFPNGLSAHSVKESSIWNNLLTLRLKRSKLQAIDGYNWMYSLSHGLVSDLSDFRFKNPESIIKIKV
ncbi:hypothetical protein [Chemarfal virus 1]|nr:hypothetical protein [Chemarfal virus 1]WPR17940.1 MAG: hypothetical protein [Chemarfal virus 1]